MENEKHHLSSLTENDLKSKFGNAGAQNSPAIAGNTIWDELEKMGKYYSHFPFKANDEFDSVAERAASEIRFLIEKFSQRYAKVEIEASDTILNLSRNLSNLEEVIYQRRDEVNKEQLLLRYSPAAPSILLFSLGIGLFGAAAIISFSSFGVYSLLLHVGGFLAVIGLVFNLKLSPLKTSICISLILLIIFGASFPLAQFDKQRFILTLLLLDLISGYASAVGIAGVLRKKRSAILHIGLQNEEATLVELQMKLSHAQALQVQSKELRILMREKEFAQSLHRYVQANLEYAFSHRHETNIDYNRNVISIFSEPIYGVQKCRARINFCRSLTSKEVIEVTEAFVDAYTKLSFLFFYSHKIASLGDLEFIPSTDIDKYKIFLSADFVQFEISKMSISSPGFWEVIVSLSPFEQIRQWLNDRHNRKKDKDYKNNQEERLKEIEIRKAETELEKQLVQNEFDRKSGQIDLIKKGIEVIKMLPLTDQEKDKLIKTCAIIPLSNLAIFQDAGLISTVEIITDTQEHDFDVKTA